MPTNKRKQLNSYWRDRRAAVRLAKLTADTQTLDPQVFLKNEALMVQVRRWIAIAGVNYARKSLAETGVNPDGIDLIIAAVNSQR
jgi:hypothetical protein